MPYLYMLQRFQHFLWLGRNNQFQRYYIILCLVIPKEQEPVHKHKKRLDILYLA